MPLYEYQCKKDGRFELIRRFSDPPLKKCPTCGGPVEKLLAAPAIQFKGSGWYVTDYAKKSGAGASESKNGDSKSTETKSTDSSASKDAKTSTPSTSTSKDSSASKGSSAT